MPNNQELRQRLIVGVATITGTCWRESGQKWTTGLTCVVWHGVPTLSVRKVTYQNFKSFPNYWCISRDFRLTGYFIINRWKCYLLFELPCIPGINKANTCHWFIAQYCFGPYWWLSLECHDFRFLQLAFPCYLTLLSCIIHGLNIFMEHSFTIQLLPYTDEKSVFRNRCAATRFHVCREFL
jgi:hypothetical protein